jgi:UDP-N-acetylglucosamine:LPS N-acetylglucosamine transferase
VKILDILENTLKYPDKITGFKNQAHALLEKTNYKQAKRKFLFIIADSGGGHRATANAVKAAIENLLPDSCVYLMPAVDILNTPQRLFSRLIEESYNQSIKMGTYWMEPLLFNSVFIMELPVIHHYIALRNAQIIDTFQPEAIVSFVPATQEITYLALCHLKKEKEIPLYTVITDIVSMRHNWIMKEQAYSFVPTEQALAFFSNRGIPKEKMLVSGLPVHPHFYADTASKLEIQSKYNLDQNLFTIMILMGGNGSQSIYKYCKQINDLGLPVQIIACCGKSKTIKAKVEIFAKVSKIPIHVFGFTKDIPELMKVSDVLITKPGSVSIAESITQELPLLIDASSYIMWQEKGNDAYIEQNEIGMAFRTKYELTEKLTKLVAQPECYQAIKNKMTAFPKKNSTQLIANILINSRISL